MLNATKIAVQMAAGVRTHHQDSAISPVTLSTIKIRVRAEKKPMITP
jgi:hypothetical protein